eukprot:scaffold9322_cov98-Skeletonema_dohrnii-CCMP3373.AAC.1
MSDPRLGRIPSKDATSSEYCGNCQYSAKDQPPCQSHNSKNNVYVIAPLQPIDYIQRRRCPVRIKDRFRRKPWLVLHCPRGNCRRVTCSSVAGDWWRCDSDSTCLYCGKGLLLLG